MINGVEGENGIWEDIARSWTKLKYWCKEFRSGVNFRDCMKAHAGGWLVNPVMSKKETSFKLLIIDLGRSVMATVWRREL